MHKIIVAGCGGICHAWIVPALARQDCEIAALVDPFEGNALAVKEKYSLQSRVYPTLASALDNEDADLVFDMTPPRMHHSVVTEALASGRHVFGEKPMSDFLEEAEEMVSCAEKHGKEYFVMQNYRYNAQIIAFRDFLASGQLGDIWRCSARFSKCMHFGGFRDEMESPLITDMAIHTFDAARFITGTSARSVYCREFNPPWSWYKGDACAVCDFEMTGGVTFSYNGSWCAKGLETSWNSEWRVDCEQGCVYWDGADVLQYQTDKSESTSILVAPIHHTGHAACINEMFDALNNGTRPQTDCRDNIKSVRMVYKALESSRANGRVTV